MKIHDLIEEESVHLDLEGNELIGALEAVAERVAPGLGQEPGKVVQALIDRERLGSTSVGDGFAIPHCKVSGLRQVAVSLARFTSDVEFGANDDRPVRFFFVVLSPPDQPAAHLQVLSQIARVLKRPELRTELLEAEDSAAVVGALRRAAEAEGL